MHFPMEPKFCEAGLCGPASVTGIGDASISMAQYDDLNLNWVAVAMGWTSALSPEQQQEAFARAIAYYEQKYGSALDSAYRAIEAELDRRGYSIRKIAELCTIRIPGFCRGNGGHFAYVRKHDGSCSFVIQLVPQSMLSMSAQEYVDQWLGYYLPKCGDPSASTISDVGAWITVYWPLPEDVILDAQLVANPQQQDQAVEETLSSPREESPVFRTATADAGESGSEAPEKPLQATQKFPWLVVGGILAAGYFLFEGNGGRR